MTTNYMQMTVQQLLDALAAADEKPPRELLEVCYQRREELTQPLLTILAEKWVVTAEKAAWGPEDPRWLLTVHAARLLIAWRETAALPIFASIFADETQENLMDWINGNLNLYGPLLVEEFVHLLERDIWGYSKTSVIEELTTVAKRFPETRRRIITALRGVLPTLSELEGMGDESVTDDQISAWTFAAMELAELKDKEAIPIVERLHEREYIDEGVYGDFENFLAMYHPEPGRRQRRTPRTFLELYGYEE